LGGSGDGSIVFLENGCVECNVLGGCGTLMVLVKEARLEWGRFSRCRLRFVSRCLRFKASTTLSYFADTKSTSALLSYLYSTPDTDITMEDQHHVLAAIQDSPFTFWIYQRSKLSTTRCRLGSTRSVMANSAQFHRQRWNGLQGLYTC